MAMAATYLVINPGSSSVRYTIFCEEKAAFFAHFKKENKKFSVIINKNKAQEIEEQEYSNSLLFLKNNLANFTITAIGVRVVAPGTFFTQNKIVTPEYYNQLRNAYTIAPLHIESTLLLLEQCNKVYPEIPVFGISDSAFHTTMPDYAKHYALPLEDAARFDIYKFGYHGISLESCVQAIKNNAATIPERMVICHMGSGTSITAVYKGNSIETSMGFTPLEGVPMLTRVGSLDASATLLIQKNVSTTIEYLAYNSGLFGMTGLRSFADLVQKAQDGDNAAHLALNCYIQAIKKYIGAYWAILEGLDLLVFTGGIGENFASVRAAICEKLGDLEIAISPEKNNQTIDTIIMPIHHETSAVNVLVVRTNEAEILLKHMLKLL